MRLIYLRIKWLRILISVISLYGMLWIVGIFLCIVPQGFLGYSFFLCLVYDFCSCVFDERKRIWTSASNRNSKKSKADNKSKLRIPNWTIPIRTKFEKRTNKIKCSAKNKRFFSKSLEIRSIDIIIESSIHKLREARINNEQNNGFIHSRNKIQKHRREKIITKITIRR